MIDYTKYRRQTNSMTVYTKEFQRVISRNKKTVILNLLINGNDGELFQLQFPYDLAKDTPTNVANEMMEALSLTEEDLPRLQNTIQEELKNTQELLKCRKISECNKSSLSPFAIRKDTSDKELHQKIEEVLKIIESCNNKSDLSMSLCENINELDKVFIGELINLSKGYKNKLNELNKIN